METVPLNDDGVAAGFRTSPQQRHIWSTSASTGLTQWVQLTATVDGEIDSAQLAAAVRAVGARHEILRTRLHSLAGHAAPVQVIDDVALGLAAEHDLTDAADELPQLIAAERGHLADRPAVRVVLVRLAAERSTLIITGPAVLVDRRSLRLLLAEIAGGYAGAEAEPVSVQYADFAAWHNTLLDQDDDQAARRTYWDGHVDPALIGDLESIVTPAGPEPGEWRTNRCWLDDGVSAATAALGADEPVFAAAWAVLLWRLCGERDIALRAIVPGRSYRELDGAIGPFARDLPLIGQFGNDFSFRAVVDRVRAALGDAIEHADDLDPARLDIGFSAASPGFEYVEPAEPVAAAGLVFRPELEDGRGGAPLLLRAGRAGQRCWVELGHDVSRLAPARADELLSRFVAVLEAMAGAPADPIGAANLLLPGEADRLIAAGHGPEPVRAEGRTLHWLVSEQASRTPDAIAVEDDRTELTYAELDRWSDRFAGRLADHGVGRGDLVVLFMERSAEFVVSLLAVLKAGAGYVPVDLRQPAQRLEFLLADTNAPLLVTGPSTPVPAGLPVPVLRCAAGDDPVAATTEPSPNETGRDDVAYVMYTSGSTGVPNGVPVTHGALLNYLLWATDAYDLRSGNGSLVHSSIGFDLTVTGLLGPLLVGQRVRFVPESDGLGGLVSALRSAEDLTLVKLTPSHLVALPALVEPAQLASRVRTLVVGGEQLRAEALAGFRGGPRIVNEYGPTETVVGSTAYEVSQQTPHAGPVPIGRPIAGTSVYLLDAAMRPVPDGVPGEIYIGGTGVASGYLGREELTGERFGADPFRPGGRLYRTGDRARRLPSGDLVFLGRADDQLKVRGFRVEPGEIEAVLAEHPLVGQAAVVVTDSPSGSNGAEPTKRLAACIVPTAGNAEAPTTAQLLAFCQERLPDYLVPAVFVPVTALPTTPNGKLDRAGVAWLAGGSPAAAAPFTPPRTEIEEILAGAIAAVLGCDRVGIDDNYFVIGGDSIRSVMVASRAQARGLSVSVADLHRYPTVRALAEVIATGSQAVPELRTEPFALVSAEDRALMPPDVEDAFPLCLLQEGMIFHRDFAAKSAVYHAIASVRLRAPLDVDVLRKVIRELVERHPMLRTSFDQTTFSRPLQLVHAVFDDPLSYEDLRGMSAAEQQARIAGWVEREKQRGFELEEHPLIRFMAQRLDDESFQFTYGFHHEIVDGWSEALMVTELFGHYFSIIYDEPVALAPPVSSMRDAVALELEALDRKENYEFWSRYLADATLMQLPRLDSGPKADKGAREIVRLAVPVSEPTSDGLKRLATANAVPLKSVLLAAHMAVMNHYHGQQDTLTYTVTNGRPESADGSTAIGLFVNSLALRVRMSGGTWNELIAATLDSERQSMPYRRLPMAELKRHQGNEPLAETLFFFTDYHVFRELERWRAKGVEHMASELYGESTFPFCAIFRLNRETSQLEVRIEYDSLQFPAKLMDEMAECYTRVLETIVAGPDERYDTRSLLSESERAKVLVEWNSSEPATVAAVADDERIHDVIARWVRQTPDAVAVSYGDAVLTYAALDRMAGRVAGMLAAHGAGPDRPVALLAERSLETVVCLLGILKAGAAYLPLDPGYPDDRIRAIVDSAAPVAVLAQPEHVGRVHTSAPVFPIEPGLPFAGASAGTATALADHAAYVMYTSGSTGEPKGVVITHRALVNSTIARTRVYPQRPDRFLLLSSLVFDSSVAGLFWPLCTGGTLVLPPEGIQLEPAALARHIAEHAATHTLAVPSLLTALFDQGEPQRLSSLRMVIAAGEASSRELYEDHQAALPGCTFHNEYGPTENTVWSTVWSGEPLAHRPQLPIGRPVPGVRTYVLNTHRHPVPVGVPGELYLGGAGLARGYLGRPGLTAANFVPDPFANEPGARLYRSGDLARHTPDGELEFLGRTDNQVKIRGFRVELGEIEGVLDAHPDVHRSVVLAREDSTGEKMLVAYVATDPGAAPAPAELQRYVRDRLPKYMVPATCVVLDALPLAATGKIDRSSLPVPGASAQRSTELVSPRTETEQLVADIWRQALGSEELGVNDEFFEIGGESLRAMQVVTKTNKVFGLDLSVRTLFDAPTVATFALTVDEARVAERV